MASRSIGTTGTYAFESTVPFAELELRRIDAVIEQRVRALESTPATATTASTTQTSGTTTATDAATTTTASTTSAASGSSKREQTPVVQDKLRLESREAIALAQRQLLQEHWQQVSTAVELLHEQYQLRKQQLKQQQQQQQLQTQLAKLKSVVSAKIEPALGNTCLFVCLFFWFFFL